MKQRMCRATVFKQPGQKMGRGFVVDADHIMTCRHVVDMSLDRAPVIGDLVRVRHEAQDPSTPDLMMAVAKLGTATLDVCVLRRTDDASFAPGECVLWQTAKVGSTYFGLGLSKANDDLGLMGVVQAPSEGMMLQLLTAPQLDNRIEPGSSGAALFGVGDEAMIGMVVTYQQQQSGAMIPASVLAEFWPSLKRFAPAPDEGFPTLTTIAPQEVRLDRLITEVDRVTQQGQLTSAIVAHGLMQQPGYLVAQISAVYDDLPNECAKMLRNEAFKWNKAQIAPGSTKQMPYKFLTLAEVLDFSDDPGESLLQALCIELDAASPSLANVGEAYGRSLAPLAIVVTVDRDNGEVDRLTPELVTVWGRVLAGLARPDSMMPIALFISVVGGSATQGPVSLFPTPREPWQVTLKELSTITRAHIDNWCDRNLADDAMGRQARVKLDRIVASHSNGRSEFRLRELRTWFSIDG